MIGVPPTDPGLAHTTVHCADQSQAFFVSAGFAQSGLPGQNETILQHSAPLGMIRQSLEDAAARELMFRGSSESSGGAFLFAAVDGALYWTPAHRSEGELQPIVSCDLAAGEATGFLEGLAYLIALDRISSRQRDSPKAFTARAPE